MGRSDTGSATERDAEIVIGGLVRLGSISERLLILAAAAMAPSGDVELSASGAVSVPGIAGAADDVLACAPTSTGPATACNW